jgi:hypothetical protein
LPSGKNQRRKEEMSESRGPQHVRNFPLPGDVIELMEREIDPVAGEEFAAGNMLRVIAVNEDRVWFKQYGLGHELITLRKWQERYDRACVRKLIRGADHDAPF